MGEFDFTNITGGVRMGHFAGDGRSSERAVKYAETEVQRMQRERCLSCTKKKCRGRCRDLEKDERYIHKAVEVTARKGKKVMIFRTATEAAKHFNVACSTITRNIKKNLPLDGWTLTRKEE